MKRIIVLITAVFFVVPVMGHAQVTKSTIDDQTNVEVTVYNSNIGLVKDTRKLTLPTGEGELRFMDVASAIKPVTVSVTSLNAPASFMVLEQNYEYDLMNQQKLMDKYVGKDVKIIKENFYQGTKEEVSAKLLSNNSGQIYQINDEIFLGYGGQVVLPKIPENLIAKPTLTWLFENDQSAAHTLEVSYLTNNINWKADYVMTVNKDDSAADLSGWVTVDNRSGTMYKDAKLKLVAGEVNRVHEGRGRYAERELMRDEISMPKSSGFAEESFFEYHIYDLQRPTTIKNNQTKQISLLSANDINIEKEFIVYGSHYFYRNRQGDIPESKVGVYLKFKNEEENNLGMPLPAGTIRLYKADSKDSLQFIGEDRIDHTPKNEEIKLKIGDAFDVIAERKQMGYQNLNNRAIETKWQVTLRNHKEEDIVVKVVEPVHGEWHVMQATHDYKKVDARTLAFNIPVPKDGEVNLIYRVRVSFR